MGDRVFFSLMPVLLWAAVLFGFTKTYFGAGLVMAPLPNLLIHIHGAAFTLWMVLLVVQTGLITTRHVKWHMTLGVGGFCLAVLMVVLGLLAAVDALRRGSGPLGLDPVTFFVVPATSIVLFAVMIFFAYKWRKNPEAHKRADHDCNNLPDGCGDWTLAGCGAATAPSLAEFRFVWLPIVVGVV